MVGVLESRRGAGVWEIGRWIVSVWGTTCEVHTNFNK